MKESDIPSKGIKFLSMTIDPLQPEPFSYSFREIVRRAAKPSHRFFSEQCVGLGIFLLIWFSVEWLNGWLIHQSLGDSWFRNLLLTPWILTDAGYGAAWTLYYFVLAISIWTLWRRHSLRVLKLEFSIFFAQLIFQVAWTTSFFILHETLVSLSALVLLWCNNLLAALLFWKKERIAGQMLLFPFAWIFYVMGLNMVICISNP